MNPEFYCKQCEKRVEVKVIQTYAKKTWYSIYEVGTYGDVPTKFKNWKRYGKVIVLAHIKKIGFFKKIQCPNSNTQIKMVVDEGSKSLYELSDSEAKKWIESGK